MKSIFNHPKILQNKVFITGLVGIACAIFGVGYFLFAKDKIFLTLSLLLMGACVFKSIEYYFIVLNGKYVIISGTCVGISTSLIKKIRTIRIIDFDGNEISLKLGSNYRLMIGKEYNFYFASYENCDTGNEFIDTHLATDYFLGMEVIVQNEKTQHIVGNE